jgi:hypothetical protein
MVRHDGASEPVSWRPEHLLEDRYSSHSDTSAIMPNFQRPVIAAGQRYVCHVLEPDRMTGDVVLVSSVPTLRPAQRNDRPGSALTEAAS